VVYLSLIARCCRKPEECMVQPKVAFSNKVSKNTSLSYFPDSSQHIYVLMENCTMFPGSFGYNDRAP
jgi:hypothetical protein